MLSPTELTALPTPADVAFYRDHGYYVSRPILSDHLLDDALRGVERHHAGQRDAKLPIAGGFLDWKPRHGDKLRLSDYTSLQTEELRRLVHTPIIAAIAARLCGSHRVRLFHDQLVYKPPTSANTETSIGWHTDRAYWATCSSLDMLTAWVPLVDMDPAMGPIAVFDGSHRFPGTSDLRTFRETDLHAREQRLAELGHRLVEVPLAMTRGQVSFHHCLTIHGSHPNQSSRPRIALTIHLQDDTNRHVPKAGPDGRPLLHVNDMMCRTDARGLPDYTDPVVCPVLWDDDHALEQEPVQ